MRDEAVIERPVDHRTLTRRYTEEAVALHRGEPARPVLPLPRAQSCRTSRWRARRSSPARATAASTATSSRSSTGASASILDALRTAGIDRHTLVRVHQRQRSVAAVPHARRIGRPAARGQGHHLGGRRAHAGDLLVAGDDSAGDGHRHRLGDGSAADGGGSRPAPRCPPGARSTASARPALRTGRGPARDRRCSTTGIASCGPSARAATRRTSSPAAPTARASGAPSTMPPLLFDLHDRSRRARRHRRGASRGRRRPAARGRSASPHGRADRAAVPASLAAAPKPDRGRGFATAASWVLYCRHERSGS